MGMSQYLNIEFSKRVIDLFKSCNKRKSLPAALNYIGKNFACETEDYYSTIHNLLQGNVYIGTT